MSDALTWLPIVALGLLPWGLLGTFLAFGLREPRPLPSDPEPLGPEETGEPGVPLVSIIVPARNEAGNITRCLASLTRLTGVPFEILVVDDRSTDGTGEEARAVPTGNALSVRVVEGGDLPEGWFGKPWACRQGADLARGRFLLFTDADTVHHPDLLLRAVRAMEEDDAGLLSLLGRQEMGTFGEKLVQPQIFLLIGTRYRSLHQTIPPDRWKDAIANGQFILVRRTPYEAIQGHGAVRSEVVEDLRLAQAMARGGSRVTVRRAEKVFSTRMYTSLRSLVDGWTKNVAIGARQASGRLSPLALPGIILFLTFFWLLPAGAFFAAALTWLLAGGAAGAAVPAWVAPVAVWGGSTWTLGTFIWVGAYRRFGAPVALGLIHPIGSAVVIYIVLRSWIRGGRRIEWKGRRYGATTPSSG